MKPYYKNYELKAIAKGNWILFEDLEHYFQVESVTQYCITINLCWVDYKDNLTHWNAKKMFWNIQDFNKWYMNAKKEWVLCKIR